MFSYLTLVAVAVTGMLAQPVTASPLTGAISSSTFSPDTVDNSFKAWGQFCNDLSCGDCGTWVDLSNSGCLQETTNRQAVNIKSNGPEALVGLIYTPNNQCSCQSECDAITGTGCWQLNSTRAAETESYRFVNFGDLGSVCSNAVTNC